MQSRYYNPQWKRFVNADAFCDTEAGAISTNMFAYCESNPINFVDPTGYAKAPSDLEAYIKATFGSAISNSKGQDVSVSVKGNKITITAYFWIDTKNNTKKDVILNGIKEYWKGNFTVFGYKNVALETKVTEVKRNIFDNSQWCVDIYSYAKYNSKYKAFTSVMKDGKYDTFSNWKPSARKRIEFYEYGSNNKLRSDKEIKSDAAHEFAHVLGIQTDLYSSSATLQKKYKNSIMYIYGDNRFKLTGTDIEKVLTAFAKKKYQKYE
ncbi:hypothetical protein AGMMS50284_4820 [Clostridia bacterium]|nr:hypothetical protein AGMMS50284_4820 [Clostridia bacterium]